MKKSQRLFICQSCGTEFSRWAGKCESCGKWNTIVEESNSERFKSTSLNSKSAKFASPKPIHLLEEDNDLRMSTGFSELDLVLGGGIVPGSVILIGGEPGVGKSTLLLEIARNISKTKKIIYVSGEESASQISLRAKRMKIDSANIFISSETYIENIADMTKLEKPDIVFIDSIQTVSKETLINQAGTVTQLRESTQSILETAKSLSVPFIVVGHITKEGSIAGPKVLEHLVDVVLYFESDKLNYYRLIRGVKNRFGAVGDVAVFGMSSDGLSELKDKHNIFISTGQEKRTGSAISAVMEGSRAMSVEVQALVSRTSFSQARRMAEGMDNRRLVLMAAVLEKFLSLKLSECDIFSNLTGGLQIDEPALDLAVCSVIISSYLDKPLRSGVAILGEVGLSGEVRPVSHINLRLRELSALGVKEIIIPKGNAKEADTKEIGIPLKYLENVRELDSFF